MQALLASVERLGNNPAGQFASARRVAGIERVMDAIRPRATRGEFEIRGDTMRRKSSVWKFLPVIFAATSNTRPTITPSNKGK